MHQIIIHITETKKVYKKETLNLAPKGINARKYCGVLKLREDSLQIQKRLRDE